MNSYVSPPRLTRRTLMQRCLQALSSLAPLLFLFGCGNGGSSNPNPNPPGGNPNPNGSRSVVSGTVTDIDGAAIVGATVQIGSQSATTTQFGTYRIADVEVPAGQSSRVATLTAAITINGNAWSGQNTVEVLAGEANTPNVHLVASETSRQGSITGTLRDSQNRPLASARVFAGASAMDLQNNEFFTNLSSFTTYTDANGRYTLPNLPPLNGSTTPPSYTVTASFAGHTNQTLRIPVTSGNASQANFTLPISNVGGNVPVVDELSALSVTVPTSPGTRAADASRLEHGFNALRHFILERKGLLQKRAALTDKIERRNLSSRATPSGSLIETDLFWNYQQLNNLFGYVVLRSDNTDSNFRTISLLRDPLATRFSDLDNALTPGLLYYYSVARLDTVDFPANGLEGDPLDPPVVVRPLDAMNLAGPANQSPTTTTPVFSWAALPGANKYQILVYDRYPDYQSDTSSDGVRPIWPADPQNPGSSLVFDGGGTLQIYDGPALQRGQTYYWAIIASDSVNSAFSVSPIRSFTVQ